ncbi:MAG TPA: rhomboid family intramembrane serine protease [Solirubrobacteraceae bacterium]|jgi:membrane associated rhomboid family serine protease|nr:rhomboid family intramembrane serine protease [Solirubrobacteraceae bacterium]
MATCYRHPGRETGVSCSNCGRPICPDCMTTSPVGMRCPECARQTTKVRTIASTQSHRGYQVTVALIIINVIVFLAEGSNVFSLTGATDNSWLLSHGWLAAPYVRSTGAILGAPDHQYYRLLTSGFLHLDFLHIASNMYVLYWVGRLLEPAIGSRRFIALYFTGLLAGSLGVLIVSPLNVTAGASGAIFALMGGAFTEAHRRGIDAVRNQLVLLIVINLVLTLSLPNISIGAHLGGLIGGGVVTLGFQQADRLRRPALGYAIAGALSVIAVAASILIANSTT